MEYTIQRESVEAVLAWLAAAGSAGVIIGYGAATHSNLVGGYGMLAIGGGLSGIVIGQLINQLADGDEIPIVGIAGTAPNNATTGFYIVAAAVMSFGLGIEIISGTQNPVLMALFGTGSMLCLVRGLHRGTQNGSNRVMVATSV